MRSFPFRKLRFLRPALAALALAVPAALLAPVADAQYFGRNKVRYDDFDFRVLETEHFDLFYYPEEEQAARDVARMAERWYTRLSAILQHTFDERKTIILYADDADFRQTNAVSGLIGEGTQGVTEGLKQRVVLPVGATYAETDHVLGHELVHQFQYDIAQRGNRFQQFVRLPLFLIEGLAEYLSVGREDALTAMWMRDALLRDAFPTVDQLVSNPRFNEYQYGQPFWAYVGGVYGDEAAVRLFKTALEMPLDSAIVTVTGLPSDTLSARWEDALREAFLPTVEDRTLPNQIAEAIRENEEDPDEDARPLPDSVRAALRPTAARRVLARDLDAGDLNIAPQVSPDGRYVAFLSERDLFGIDLFLADAETGRILKQLQSVGTDPHIDAIRFIESAGTWSPDSRRFAYVVFAGGDNEIAILDVRSRDVEQRIAVRDIGAIKDPAWSPDGRRIAFTGIRGGIADLYVVDVEGGTVRQLTNDRYADLQPAWSPDGQTLAFVTDRGPGTDFDRLTYAPMRLALYDLSSGEIETLTLFAGAKHINPAFSPDGRSLFFISDRDGFNNVYRLDRDTGGLFRVTDLATGVAGIADLSPALSVAQQSGRMMYSVFEAQKYTVYALEREQTQGTPVEPVGPEAEQAVLLPPAAAHSRSVVEGYLADETGGLPATRAFPDRSYRPGLQLDYVSQPSVGAIYDPYYGSGFGVAGGVSFLFSDELSDHVLGVAIAANGTIQDVGGQAIYLNRKSRFNYGVQIGHIPYLQTFIDVAPSSDPDAASPTRYYYRTLVSQAAALAAYPLSQTRRFEGEVGYRRIGYDLDYDRYVITDDGFIQFLGREEVPGSDSLFDALHLAEGGVAFVGDYSSFGFTSPARGGRYRLGVDGILGSLDFATVTADYRRYFLLRVPGFPQRLPLTFAARALHYGRYGPDATSGRLTPLYLGYGALVRGYSSSSFESNAAYNAFEDRLFGSRLGVANAEIRLPLLGTTGYGLVNFPFAPAELTFFADAGMAWGTIQEFQLQGPGGEGTIAIGTPFSEQRPIFSVGSSIRFNILGALVLEPYYAFPLSRDDRTAVFGLNFLPGW
ncbi:MAG TPA: peptidase S9 [Rubricoccaceae bacterium]|nr:peptidase S9 [Rubricoccaceae bacterium]